MPNFDCSNMGNASVGDKDAELILTIQSPRVFESQTTPLAAINNVSNRFLILDLSFPPLQKKVHSKDLALLLVFIFESYMLKLQFSKRNKNN